MSSKLNELAKHVSKRMSEDKPKKHWIQGAIKHPGALHKELGVPEGKKIPAGKLEKAEHSGGTLGKRARLAETLSKMHHK